MSARQETLPAEAPKRKRLSFDEQSRATAAATATRETLRVETAKLSPAARELARVLAVRALQQWDPNAEATS